MMSGMRRFTAVAALLALGACGIFSSDKDDGTPVVGNRVAVLPGETGIEADAALAATPVTLPLAAQNVDWTQPGGSAAKALGHVAFAETPQRIWSVSIGRGTDGSAHLVATPVIEGGRIFAMDTKSVITALNAETGARIWSQTLEKEEEQVRGAFGGGVSVFGGRVYATSGYGLVAAYDATSGEEIWRENLVVPLRGAPTVAAGRVMVMTQDNQLLALNASDGERQWEVVATVEPAGLLGAASPAVAQGTAIVGFSSGELTAVRIENGRTVWQDALSRTARTTSLAALSDIDAPAVIDNGQVFAIGHGGRMVALQLTSGQRSWEQSLAGVSLPWLAGNWLFASTTKGEVVAIARNDGRIRWVSQLPAFRNAEKNKGPIYYRGPILAGGRLWLTSSEGQLISMSPQDGTVTSTEEAGDDFFLPPVVAGGIMYLLDEKGNLSAWR
ncbi:MAG: PQQ-binding-like beta-propeller repeat protein [Pseudomonadota bacterium]